MKHTVTRISPIQAGKLSAIIYGAIGLVFIPLASLVVHKNDESGFGLSFAIGAALGYATLAFLGTASLAAFYNLVTRWVGGLEIELSTDEDGGPDLLS